ncbi:hypothetical protein BGZ54_007149 [Gamsiella multidivaricata]|nr:hypothetical protein BGZ54_007149 [Gamsiella multidivaricata]
MIDSVIKSGLIAGLKEQGWNMCHCIGETDIHIGRKAKQHPGQVMVALINSDILVHRKDSYNRTSTSYEVEDVVQKLEVNEPQCIVANITTNNDYTAHVPGQSFAKCCADVIRTTSRAS